jgi:hypothetical protein
VVKNAVSDQYVPQYLLQCILVLEDEKKKLGCTGDLEMMIFLGSRELGKTKTVPRGARNFDR